MSKLYTRDDLKNYKIAIICGGNSNEREVSLNSGSMVYEALSTSGLGLDVTKIDTKDYNLLQLKEDGYNLVFNILHGRFGEDGRVQAILDFLGIKYTGCRVLQSALTLDKIMTKKVWFASGVETIRSINLTSKEVLGNQVDVNAIVEQLGLPIFVKPNVEGSSVGVTKVKRKEDLYEALVVAARIDNDILVEPFIDGQEYSVPVLNGKALAAIEIIVPESQEFYDYHAKYISDETRYECPANLSEAQTARILDLAERATKAVGINSWCRVDVLSNSKGEFFALEVNTNPGMTSHSLMPMGAKHRGMSYTDLCIQVLLNSINDVENS